MTPATTRSFAATAVLAATSSGTKYRCANPCRSGRGGNRRLLVAFVLRDRQRSDADAVGADAGDSAGLEFIAGLLEHLHQQMRLLVRGEVVGGAQMHERWC